jgi:hypothetical protein
MLENKKIWCWDIFFLILKWWYIGSYIFLKKIKKAILNWPGSIIVNLWKSRSRVWDYDKIMKSVSKQTRKSNYNEPNVKS